jgi:hypothetical protein
LGLHPASGDAEEWDHVFAYVTIPSGMNRALRANLTRLGRSGLRDLLRQVSDRLSAALRKDPGACPWLLLLQRRYPSQRAEPTIDARLGFDLRTAFPGRARKGPKAQAEWLNAAIEAFLAKRSNMQLSIGAIFPYETSRVVGTPKATDFIEATWVSCRPLIDAAMRK